MVLGFVRRIVSALGRRFVRLGRYWATQFGLGSALTWAPHAAHLVREEETEHWDWSIPYLWYEASH